MFCAFLRVLLPETITIFLVWLSRRGNNAQVSKRPFFLPIEGYQQEMKRLARLARA